MTLIRVIDLNHEQSLCDIGTGAGFPGIVLKIFYPHLVLTLVDALNKRIKFLEVVVRELGLEKVTLIHDRAEEYAIKNREKFDVVTARAVASLNILLEYSLPLVKVNKHFIAMKGNENTKNSLNALALLSGKIVLEDEFMLPRENAKRNLIKVIKVKETATRYPRKFSEIKKRPL